MGPRTGSPVVDIFGWFELMSMEYLVGNYYLMIFTAKLFGHGIYPMGMDGTLGGWSVNKYTLIFQVASE
jgi:hypothetical protein